MGQVDGSANLSSLDGTSSNASRHSCQGHAYLHMACSKCLLASGNSCMMSWSTQQMVCSPSTLGPNTMGGDHCRCTSA